MNNQLRLLADGSSRHAATNTTSTCPFFAKSAIKSIYAICRNTSGPLISMRRSLFGMISYAIMSPLICLISPLCDHIRLDLISLPIFPGRRYWLEHKKSPAVSRRGGIRNDAKIRNDGGESPSPARQGPTAPSSQAREH